MRSDPTREVRVVVHGRVQGVGFRHWTRTRAEALGLRGWVRNRRDGTVEAVFAGAADAVATMLAELRRGPRAAEVLAVEELPAGMREAGEGGFAEHDTA